MYAKNPVENLRFSSSLAEGDATNSFDNTVELEEERIKGACLTEINRSTACLPPRFLSRAAELA